MIVTGLTSVQMTDSKNFTDADWSTADWSFYNGYTPRLAWQLSIQIIRLQVGVNSDSDSAIFIETSFKIGDFKLNLMSTNGAVDAIKSIDELLENINRKVSDFGAILNRLDSVLQSQATQIENLTASKSTILDADIAEESAIYVKSQILQQTSASLLTQSQAIHKNMILGLIQ